MEQITHELRPRDNRTREQLCAALKSLLCTKPLDQIRVREVAERCGMRRQSFYYHFTDVYALFEWSVDRERDRLRRRQERCFTGRQALRSLMRCIEEERPYYLALRSDRRPGQLQRVLRGAAEDLAGQMTVYYARRAGGELSQEALRRRTEVGTGILLALLDAWLSGQLERPEQLYDTWEEWMRQVALGEAWQNQCV